MVIDMENVIRDRRKELGLSQEELAKKCGVSRQTVNVIENNKYDPTLSLAFSLARELVITVDELFYRRKMETQHKGKEPFKAFLCLRRVALAT